MEHEKQMFDKTYVAAVKEEEASPELTEKKAMYADYMSPLGLYIRGLFDQVESDRRQIEQEWIKDLRQYKGQYDPGILSKMHPKRSKANLSITRTKVKTVSARVCDILFPANGDRNWGITPTPLPELSPDLVEQIYAQLTEINGQEPSPHQIKQVLFDEAKRRSDSMQKEIEDQLAEIKYREIIRNVIHSGNVYGTGILKGPLIKQNVAKRWVPHESGTWATMSMTSYSPYCEFVPIWDFYPDMSVNRVDDARFVFQRHVKNRHQVYQLAGRKDFKGDAIRAYLRAHHDGDVEYKNHESDLRTLSQDGESKAATQMGAKGRYELLEFWGFVSTQDLKDYGVEIDEERLGMEVAANVWLLGDVVIKAVISPLEGVTFPYFTYYYEKDETSIFGEGIPRIMRDPQSLFNASVRALLDNAAISAGPIIEANIDLLDSAEDPQDIYPFRVFRRNGQGMEASAKAINVNQIPSHTSEFLTMVEFFLKTADEVTTVPRYMYGDQAHLGGAGKTATGLSLLMGSANITIKDQVKNFDDGITKPFIKSMYFWNMEFNPKPEIKGDFSVNAEGSASLIAKEVRAEQLNQFLALTNNEIDMQFVNRDAILREIAKALDLDEMNLIKNPDQVADEQQRAAAAAEEEKQFMRELELMKAKSSGHVNDEGSTERPGLPHMEQLPPEQLEQGAIPEVTVG